MTFLAFKSTSGTPGKSSRSSVAQDLFTGGGAGTGARTGGGSVIANGVQRSKEMTEKMLTDEGSGGGGDGGGDSGGGGGEEQGQEGNDGTQGAAGSNQSTVAKGRTIQGYDNGVQVEMEGREYGIGNGGDDDVEDESLAGSIGGSVGGSVSGDSMSVEAFPQPRRGCSPLYVDTKNVMEMVEESSSKHTVVSEV